MSTTPFYLQKTSQELEDLYRSMQSKALLRSMLFLLGGWVLTSLRGYTAALFGMISGSAVANVTVDVSARPAFPRTVSTSGNRLMILSCIWSNFEASEMDAAGTVTA